MIDANKELVCRVSLNNVSSAYFYVKFSLLCFSIAMAPRFSKAACAFIIDTVNRLKNLNISCDEVLDFIADERDQARLARPVIVEKRRVGLREARFCEEQEYVPSCTRAGKRTGRHFRDENDESELRAKRLMLAHPVAPVVPRAIVPPAVVIPPVIHPAVVPPSVLAAVVSPIVPPPSPVGSSSSSSLWFTVSGTSSPSSSPTKTPGQAAGPSQASRSGPLTSPVAGPSSSSQRTNPVAGPSSSSQGTNPVAGPSSGRRVSPYPSRRLSSSSSTDSSSPVAQPRRRGTPVPRRR